jgi:NAD(P)-dependent dehydrogenase (short-subunit alcohol dehydrogenase family)
MVTGAGRGIGQAVALALAADGWDLALVGRSGPGLAATRGRLPATGGRAVALTADVREPSQVAAAVAEAERRLGPLDALINNAGVQRLSAALEVTEDDWDDVLDTNLKGAFFCAQAAGRAMVPRGRGAIVNVASAAALVAVADRAAYASSKAGLVMLTKVLALEWGPRGVRVNAIAPTFVDTDLGRLTLAEPGRRDQITSRIPLRRIASLDDVVSAVRFLVDPAASGFITGQVLAVDGGLSIQ